MTEDRVLKHCPPFTLDFITLPSPAISQVQTQSQTSQLILGSTLQGSFIHFILEQCQDGLGKESQVALSCHLSHKFALKRDSFFPYKMSQRWSTRFRTKPRCFPTGLLTRVGRTWVFKKLALRKLEPHFMTTYQAGQWAYIVPHGQFLVKRFSCLCNPSTRRMRQEDFSKFQASLTYKTNPSPVPKKIKSPCSILFRDS